MIHIYKLTRKCYIKLQSHNVTEKELHPSFNNFSKLFSSADLFKADDYTPEKKFEQLFAERGKFYYIR
jgi:hypothetical protein